MNPTLRLLRHALTVFTTACLALPALAGNLEDGLALYRQGKPQEALAAFQRAADENNVRAFFILGALHENGEGVERDYAKAMSWYQKAAELGDTAAQSNIGTLYEKGQGVAKDLAQAASWYLKAAEAGNVQAQSNLGVLYFKGQGVAQDSLEAFKWLYLAENGGNRDAKEKRQYVQGFLHAEQLERAKKRADIWIEAWFKKNARNVAHPAATATEKPR